MIDLSKQTVNINCPVCNRKINITLNQVASEALINCECGEEIQLKDTNGNSKKAIEDLNKSFKDLEKTLKNLDK